MDSSRRLASIGARAGRSISCRSSRAMVDRRPWRRIDSHEPASAMWKTLGQCAAKYFGVRTSPTACSGCSAITRGWAQFRLPTSSSGSPRGVAATGRSSSFYLAWVRHGLFVPTRARAAGRTTAAGAGAGHGLWRMDVERSPSRGPQRRTRVMWSKMPSSSKWSSAKSRRSRDIPCAQKTTVVGIPRLSRDFSVGR